MLCQALLNYGALIPHQARCTAPAGRHRARSVCFSGSSLWQPQQDFQSQRALSSAIRIYTGNKTKFLLHRYRVLLISSKHPSLPLGSALALRSWETIPPKSQWGTSSSTTSPCQGSCWWSQPQPGEKQAEIPSAANLCFWGQAEPGVQTAAKTLLACLGLVESTIALECPVPGWDRQRLAYN